MFWAYTIGSRRTAGSEKLSGFYDPYSPSRVMLEDRGIFDYFTHFDLLETRVLYDFHSEMAVIAVNEFKRDKLPIDVVFIFI